MAQVGPLPLRFNLKPELKRAWVYSFATLVDDTNSLSFRWMSSAARPPIALLDGFNKENLQQPGYSTCRAVSCVELDEIGGTLAGTRPFHTIAFLRTPMCGGLV